MRTINLEQLDFLYDESDPPGYRAGAARLGPTIGATRMGATVYELSPGESICPYHFEYGNEEWAIVLAGRPTLRHPGGEDALERGDVVCFPEGPDGAHKLTNTGEETVHVMLLSDKQRPVVAVYPDSDKVGVFTPSDADNALFRRESGVEYYDREV
jgi:uncharacterized cupin superfamily protein